MGRALISMGRFTPVRILRFLRAAGLQRQVRGRAAEHVPSPPPRPSPSSTFVGGPRRFSRVARGKRSFFRSDGNGDHRRLSADQHVPRPALELGGEPAMGNDQRCPITCLSPSGLSAAPAASTRRCSTSTVTFRHRPPRLCKMGGQDFGHRDRPVLPPGASESDGQVALAFGLEGRQQKFCHVDDLVAERGKARIGGDVALHRRGAAIMRLERRVPVRVAQKPAVEHEVGPGRQPAAVGERGDRDRQPPGAFGREQARDLGAQVVRGQRRGVDQDVAARGPARARQPTRCPAGSARGARGWRRHSGIRRRWQKHARSQSRYKQVTARSPDRPKPSTARPRRPVAEVVEGSARDSAGQARQKSGHLEQRAA